MVGSLGVGKSRLTFEIAYEVIQDDQFPGGIYWINCAQTRVPEAIIQTIGGALGTLGVRGTEEDIYYYLASLENLLILVSFEEVANDLQRLSFLGVLPRSVQG